MTSHASIAEARAAFDAWQAAYQKWLAMCGPTQAESRQELVGWKLQSEGVHLLCEHWLALAAEVMESLDRATTLHLRHVTTDPDEWQAARQAEGLASPPGKGIAADASRAK